MFKNIIRSNIFLSTYYLKFFFSLKEEEGLITPIFRLNNLSFIWIKCNNLYLVASTRTNSNVTLVITILHKIVQVFSEYFKEMEGRSDDLFDLIS